MKKVATLLAGLLLLGILPVSIYLVSRNQDIRKRAAPATTLAVTPATLTKKVGDTFSMEITIDTGENQVVAAELHVTFDPTKLEAQSITAGTLFSNILASGTVESGAASITVGAANAKEPVKGRGVVAVIRFRAQAKTDSPTAVKLAQSTFVGGLGEGATNVLIGTTPAMVTITEGEKVPTPTPTVALQSGEATKSAVPPATPSASLTIVSPANNEETKNQRPTIQGKAAPGATVTLTIYSTPRTVTVTADPNGSWNYTPETPLEAGPHNVVASTTDQYGQTQTATAAFVVASAKNVGAGATESAIPVSGSAEITLLLILIGATFIITGFSWRRLANA